MTSLPKIMVAPNGARLTKKDHSGVPVTIPEIVQCTVDCAAAGADGVHVHVRDRSQQHILDAGLYLELMAELDRALPGFYTQITTEAVGLYSPAQQRKLVRDVQPKAVSVALREMMADSETDAQRAFYHDCHEAKMDVQHILYDLDDIHRLVAMQNDGIVPAGRLQALIVLGRYTPGQVSDPKALDVLGGTLTTLIKDVDWAVCAFGQRETECLVAARALGAKARIGFENNRMNSDLTCAANNAERVVELVNSLLLQETA